VGAKPVFTLLIDAQHNISAPIGRVEVHQPHLASMHGKSSPSRIENAVSSMSIRSQQAEPLLLSQSCFFLPLYLEEILLVVALYAGSSNAPSMTISRSDGVSGIGAWNAPYALTVKM